MKSGAKSNEEDEKSHHFKRKMRSYLLPHTFYSIEKYMYNCLVKYNALFALLYVFEKMTCSYSECSIQRSDFKLQKKITRIMVGCRSRDSCRKLFIRLKIYHCLLYIFFLSPICDKKNKELFTTNNEIHNVYTRQYLNFHQSSVNLTKYQTWVYYMGLKIFNFLPIYTLYNKSLTILRNLNLF